MPTVYYRADMRPPSTIFKSGFSPLSADKDFWWKSTIRLSEYRDNRGDPFNAGVVDASKGSAVCMSFYANSSAMFPVGDNKKDEVYVYAIALPDAIKMSYVERQHIKFFDKEQHQAREGFLGFSKVSKIGVRLEKDGSSPKDISRIVLDLHSFQATQASNILKYFHHDVDADIGWPLYAYEAITCLVPQQNIICAIKLCRDERDKSTDASIVSTRSFRVVSDIISNDAFIEREKIETINNSTVILDYKKQAEEAREVFTQWISQPQILTPNTYFGYGGKAFATPRSAL